MSEIKNAVIESTSLTIADHGQLTAWVYLLIDIGGQGFGGYSFGPATPRVVGDYDFCGEFVKRVLACAGAERWEDLKGKPLRIRGDRNKIDEIGHFLKDEWFNPAKVFADAQGLTPERTWDK